ncbi:RidA family protein [Mammaliicoccus sciuri]|uniref:RidA family protein n=1 Tax=Mammaliicoccus sciuri TaxID=1296 RepID=A0AAJ4SJ32_MAMSC|nr:RidA family protein [Mammaliicoccus sciuri]RTX74087.1 RidA family protein [Mammaliicoccus sciuri]
MPKIVRKNSSFLPEPVGNYSHITRIPKEADLIVTSGQVGVDENGAIADDFNTQVKYCFENIDKLLKSENISEENVIKVNIWATEEIDWDFFYGKWGELFDKTYPSMTVAYISKLGLPNLKIEIELWCAII